ncbi:Sialin [Halotydeus destructor]|nr:Sialin [Halotydeus destructor]
MNGTAAFIIYLLRYNLSIAIISMVIPVIQVEPETNITSEIISEAFESSCPIDEPPGGSNITTQNDPSVQNGEFFWSPSEQGSVLGAYFFGYMMTQIAGGRMAESWSAKQTQGLGVLVSSVATLLTPMAAYWGVMWTMAIRLIIGAAHGLVFSGSLPMFNAWVPKTEMSSAMAIQSAGANLGAFVSLPLVGWMCSTFHWAYSFYILGAIGVLWYFLWAVLVTDDPAAHSWITEHELNLIQANCLAKFKKEKTSIKWSSVIVSLRVWTSIVLKTANNYGYYIMGTMLPSYLAYVLQYDLKANGLLSSVNYLLVAFTSVIAGYLADKLREHKVLHITLIRKLFQTVASVGPAICFACIPFVGCDRQLIMSLMFSGMALYGFQCGGELPYVTDFAPQVSGSIFGLCNMIASLSSTFGPIIAGFIVNSNIHSRDQWNYVFYSCSIVFVSGVLFFDIFADATPDPKFANVKASKSTDTENTVDEAQ